MSNAGPRPPRGPDLLRALGALALAGLLAAIGSPGPVRADDSLGDSLDAVFRAYGGRERLLAFPGFHARGKVLSLKEGIGGTCRISVSLGEGMREEIRDPRRTEIRILAGQLAWTGGGRRQRPAPPGAADAIRLRYHELAAPFELLSVPLDSLRATGVSGEGWYRIERNWDERLTTTYEVDLETGHVVRVRGTAGSGDEAQEHIVELTDFRRVDGVLIPFRSTAFEDGEAVAEIVLERVREESEFPPEEFVPAGGTGDL